MVENRGEKKSNMLRDNTQTTRSGFRTTQTEPTAPLTLNPLVFELSHQTSDLQKIISDETESIMHYTSFREALKAST